MQLESRYFRAAAIYAVLGLLLGIHMSSSQDHSQMPTHAHLLLLGWVSLFLSVSSSSSTRRCRASWPRRTGGSPTLASS